MNAVTTYTQDPFYQLSLHVGYLKFLTYLLYGLNMSI